MATCYIEARPGEDWSSVSNAFMDWAQSRLPSGDCGYSESEVVLVNGRQFLGFSIPERHQPLNELFLEWAKVTNRSLGVVEGWRVVFPDEPGLVVAYPKKAIPTPPWLK